MKMNALAAASEVLVPIQCEYYALEGLGQLLRNVELVRKNLNPDLESQHHRSCDVRRAHQARPNRLHKRSVNILGIGWCKQMVPRSVRLSEAPSFGQPITTFVDVSWCRCLSSAGEGGCR